MNRFLTESVAAQILSRVVATYLVIVAAYRISTCTSSINTVLVLCSEQAKISARKKNGSTDRNEFWLEDTSKVRALYLNEQRE